MKLVAVIEENMHKAFKDTSHRYKAKYRTLMFNLKDPRNKVGPHANTFRHNALRVETSVRTTF